MSLAVRSRQDEQMDADDLDPATYAQVLRDLDRVNGLTLARLPTMRFLRRAVGTRERFKLLDVGYGSTSTLTARPLRARRRRRR
jgi:hypothetical protein